MLNVKLKTIELPGPPVMQDGEQCIYETRSGSPFLLVVGMILTVIPPFFFGPLCFLYRAKMKGAIKLTNDRLIFTRRGKAKRGNIECLDVPLSGIRDARSSILKSVTGSADFIFGIINVLFGYRLVIINNNGSL